jgi:ferritin-like metal-binding protein YciE
MALLANTFNNLNDLFLNQLEDLYDAENRLIDALPKMAEAANSPELKNAFLSHLNETKGHARRLEEIFSQIGEDPKRETCEAMKGLVREGSEMIHAKGDPAVRDAALIAAAQRVEHYEMAAYGSVRAFAQRLGHQDIARVLQQTLDEEGKADHLLTELAESEGGINASAGAVTHA